MNELVIMRISNDTSIMHPWGVGDIAVAMGFPGNAVVMLKCVGVNLETDGDISRVSYTLDLFDSPLGWGWSKGGDE